MLGRNGTVSPVVPFFFLSFFLFFPFFIFSSPFFPLSFFLFPSDRATRVRRVNRNGGRELQGERAVN